MTRHVLRYEPAPGSGAVLRPRSAAVVPEHAMGDPQVTHILDRLGLNPAAAVGDTHRQWLRSLLARPCLRGCMNAGFHIRCRAA